MFTTVTRVLVCVLALPLLTRAAPPAELASKAQIQLDVVLADVAADVLLKAASQPLPAARPLPVAGILKDAVELDGYIRYLQTLREKGQVKTLSEPRIVTRSGRPASVLVGGEQAIPIPAGLGQVGIQWVELGVRVNFLPVLLPSGKISLEVEPEFSSPNYASGTTITGRDTTRVNTTVQLQSGQTLLLGGIPREKGRQYVLLVTPHLLTPPATEQPATPAKATGPDAEKLRRLERKLQKLQKKIAALQDETSRKQTDR